MLARDFLCHYSRRPRIPLRGWASSSLDVLSESEPYPDVSFVAAINNAALVLAYAGERGWAKQICKREIEWIANMVVGLCPVDAAPLLRLAIDPWVNYGRLLSIEGEGDRARLHFERVFSLNSDSPVDLGAYSMDPDTWKEIKFLDPLIAEVTKAVYVIDSLKSYFQSSDYENALRFIEHVPWTNKTPLQSVVDEAKLICRSALGFHDQVLAAVAELATTHDVYFQAIQQLYAVESRLSIEPSEEGVETIRKLAVLVVLDGFQIRTADLDGQVCRCSGRSVSPPQRAEVGAHCPPEGARAC